MSLHPPSITLPNGSTVSVLDDNLCLTIDTQPPATQRKVVRLLESYLQEAHALPPDTYIRQNGVNKHKGLLADEASWQLAQCLRRSTPTRIGEAVAPLTFLVESYRRIHRNTKVDVMPGLYLAVALSRNTGDEERAIRTFNEVIEHLNDIPQRPQKNLLWARANMARLYRSMGRIADAEKQERLCREWIHGHRFTYPPSEFYAIFADDVGTGSHILDHPEVVQLFKDIKEVGPNQAILGNMGIFYNQKGPIPFANQ